MRDSAAAPPREEGVLVQHFVASFSEHWTLGEEPVPESAWHDRALDLVKALLDHWVSRIALDAAVFRNLAIRVREDQPQVGFDPDLSLVLPAPPGAHELSSLRLWEAGHVAPSLVVEVVSPTKPRKDSEEIPEKCAAIGVRELVVFDPLRVGPLVLGRTPLLQLWQRAPSGTFTRVAAGDEAVASEVLGAHLLPFEGLRRLRIADDPGGQHLWPTPEEAALAEREAERAQKEAERAQKEAALARVAELEAELGRRGG